jgi:serine/threonine-protein kinase
MATVYLAEDLKHRRRVALKVLKPELAQAIGTGRFLKEIQIAAQLTHPHILPLHDSGEAGGLLYYVMPYVEGESLRDRLDREKPLPLDDAIPILQDVADALNHAHGLGVIHRDIKPENILFTAGHAVVSDFGIARAIDAAGTEQLTETGFAVGTPSYMSPEQVSGDRAIDGRSDVYSLGCLAYEVLGGEPPFTGPTPQAVMARHVMDPVPNLRTLRSTIPAATQAAIEKALAKLPADRFLTPKAFADALTSEIGVASPTGAPKPSLTPSKWLRRLGYAVPTVLAVFVVAWALWGRSGNSPAGDQPGRIRPLTNFIGWEWSPSWSPDGSMITFTHTAGGNADVATLSVGGGDPHVLTGDSPADELNPRWSPDGSKIAFLSDRGTGTNVYWISPTGGAAHKVAETHIPFIERMGAWAWGIGANPWSPDGQELLFSRLHESGDVALWKVNLSTGEQTQITTPPTGAEDLAASWSFDGERIVYVRHQRGINAIWLLQLESGETSLLLEGEPVNSMPAWFPDNRRLALSSVRGGAVNIWEIDVDTRELRQLTFGGGIDWAPTVANNGSLAYLQFGHQIDLYWLPLDEPDAEHERLTTYTGDNFGARVSPDGNKIAYYSNRAGNHDLWILDRTTGLHRQLTDHPANDRLSDWSPDGTEIVFMSDRDGAVRLWVVDTETGVTRLLTDHELPWSTHSAEAQGGPRWAPDGSVIGYLAPEEGNAIWLVDPDGTNRRPSAVRGALSFGWYRDGQRVIYTRRATDGSGLVELRAAHLETGEDVLLRAGAIAEVAVSPDGSALTFIEAVSHFTMELYMLRLSPDVSPGQLPSVVGGPQQITFGEGQWHVHSGGWAPGGSAVVYSRDRDEGDIYMIEPSR